MLDWLLNYAAHSTLLLGAAWIISARARSHHIRETIWKAALLGGLVTATAQTVIGLTPVAGTVTIAAPAPVPLPFEAAPPDRSSTEAPLPPQPSASRPPPEPGVLPAGWGSFDWRGAIVPVWLLIAGFLIAGYLARRALLARRIEGRRPVMTHPLADLLATLTEEAGIARPIRLTASARLPSPIALGRSEIAVPEAALTELDPDQQRGMLAHELAHLERRDPAWLTLVAVVERVAFFQPLNRLARRRIRESAEYLSDEWAVGRTGSGVFLAKCLAKVAEWMDSCPSPVPVAGMAEERSHLVARVRRLLDSTPFPTGPRGRTLAIVAAVAVLAVAAAVPGISLAVNPGQDSGSQDEPGLRIENQDTSRAIVRALMEATRDSDAGVRRAALSSLARFEDPSTVATFREALRDQDAEIRVVAIHALAEFKDRGSVGAIAALLTDENTELRRAAVQALAELPAGTARNELIAAIRDSDAEVRAGAIHALAELKDPAAAGALTAALKDARAEVRAQAIEALAELELTEAPEGLIAALRDPNAEVRHAAAHAVGHYQDARAVPELRAMLEDADAEVREAAVEALSEIRTDAARDALIAALKSRDPKVRRAAADALGERKE